MLVREIIVSALNELQIYGVGEDVSPDDLSRGFQSMNTMLDSWSTESLTCFAILEQSITLQPTVSLYTVGPGGTIDTDQGGQRPIRLITGQGAAYVQDAQGNNYPVNVVTQAQWNSIGNRVVTNSNFPDTLFYDPQFPTANLNVYPVPNQANTLFFDAFLQLQKFQSVDQDINLPPGYAKALQHNLAIELEPMYPIARLSDTTVRLASIAKGNVKRANSGDMTAVYDGEIISRAPGTYNIFTDSYNPSSWR